MRTLLIRENDAGQRLDKFLHKAVPKLPQSLLYKYLRTKRIKVNGRRSEISYRLLSGDTVELYINDEFFEESPERDFLLAPATVDIVYEDENILLADKPAGLCVHEDNDNTVDTLIHRILHYLYDKGEYRPEDELSFTPALCNRIDRNTSGIVIAAKNAESLRILNEAIRQREIQKFYLCVVDGAVRPPQGTMTAYLLRRENDSTVEVFDRPRPDARTIVTSYRTLKSSRRNTLLEVELKTGRTHQIRAHFAHIGHPLLGDGKYGIGKLNREYGLRQQLLCSYKLRFAFSGEEHLLTYLNGREISLPLSKIWFAEEFEERF